MCSCPRAVILEQAGGLVDVPGLRMTERRESALARLTLALRGLRQLGQRGDYVHRCRSLLDIQAT